MKTKQISSKGLSLTGVGPWLVLTILPFLITGVILQIFVPSVVAIPFFEAETSKNAGWMLIIPGFIFWLSAVVQFSIGFPKGELITTGLYSVSRNPIYTSWILFILPGIAGIFNNWIFLFAALAMYISILLFIKEEENQMLVHFGDLYKEYYQKVGRIL